MNFPNMPFGDGGKISNQLASAIGSYIRSTKVTGTDSAAAADAAKGVKGKTVPPNAPTDGFEAVLNIDKPMAQLEVDFSAETFEACEWAANQSLAEAVDHFENDEVGNGLMLMSLLD